MSQGAISVSWAHPDVSSTSVRIGRRRFVTNVSPTAAASFMNHARLASIDIHSVKSRALNAQASTTWVPWVFTTLMRCPAPTRAALPPHLQRKVGVGDHRDGAEDVDLCEELDEVPRLRRARLDPVAAVGGEASDLEDVEHIVHVELGKVVRSDRAHEVTVAAEVELLPVV